MCGQGEVLFLEVLILAGTPVPFPYNHPGVEPVKFLQGVGENQALTLIIEVDILVCHSIQWAM